MRSIWPRPIPIFKLYLVDVPEVLEVAREIAKSFRISKPVTYLGLDLRVSDIEGTFDIILVSNTLHMLGESESRRLLSKMFPHVAPGGSLVIQAQFLDDNRTRATLACAARPHPTLHY